jgi:hypothetical protein
MASSSVDRRRVAAASILMIPEARRRRHARSGLGLVGNGLEGACADDEDKCGRALGDESEGLATAGASANAATATVPAAAVLPPPLLQKLSLKLQRMMVKRKLKPLLMAARAAVAPQQIKPCFPLRPHDCQLWPVDWGSAHAYMHLDITHCRIAGSSQCLCLDCNCLIGRPRLRQLTMRPFDGSALAVVSCSEAALAHLLGE